jgi:serine/threonine protein kinase
MPRQVIMVGGPAHGNLCTVIKSGVYYDDDEAPGYALETIETRNPLNHVSGHQIAVHETLLLHRKLPPSNIMFQACEDALQAYLLDALFRARR